MFAELLNDENAHPVKIEILKAILSCKASNPVFIRETLVAAIDSIDKAAEAESRLLASLTSDSE